MMAFNTFSTDFFIKQHGRPLTLRKRTTGTYDVSTGTVTQAYTDYQAYGYSSKTVPYELSDNSTVLNSRNIILTSHQIDGSNLPTPKVTDQVIVDGYTVDVTYVDVVKSNETVIYYTLKTKG